LAIITNAGGLGVMAADALADYGYEPASLNAETFQKLDEILPPYWSKRNPIDLKLNLLFIWLSILILINMKNILKRVRVLIYSSARFGLKMHHF